MPETDKRVGKGAAVGQLSIPPRKRIGRPPSRLRDELGRVVRQDAPKRNALTRERLADAEGVEVDEIPLEASPRIVAAGKIADRTERAERLTAILRSQDASGAEVVAASRLLDGMDTRDSVDSTGIPPPASKDEMVTRLVRMLTCAPPEWRLEALEIVSRRAKSLRTRLDQMKGIGLEGTIKQLEQLEEEGRYGAEEKEPEGAPASGDAAGVFVDNAGPQAAN